MKVGTRGFSGLVALTLLLTGTSLTFANSPPVRCWNVDELRPGMKGQGKTVVKGVKIETFNVELLGVLKNTSPGRDMVLAQLSGLNLDRTGVIAGMSGSPVYIEGKLVGAVAYAWQFGKEPLAGITPFAQMREAADLYEQRDLAETGKPRQIGLRQPVRVGGRDFERVTVSNGFDDRPGSTSDLRLQPLRTPLASSGITEHVLDLLGDKLRPHGMVPVSGGAASARVIEEARNIPLEPGGALSVALIQGDFDLSGIGTVTHVEGRRVWGWGHPFLSLGGCDFPLMTGYVHAICPRQSLSFKMGSPLRNVGVINADTSTCIAGWLGKEPDLLPIKVAITREPEGKTRTFKVKIVRHRGLLTNLVFTALTNAIDMEGELPEEMTAEMSVRINLEGREPLMLRDTFAGSSVAGGRAPAALFSPIIAMLAQLNLNPYEPVRFESLECSARIRPGRQAAEIDSVELERTLYAPGETVKGTVYLKPHKGLMRRVPIQMTLPGDFPEGEHSLSVSDDPSNIRSAIRDNPNLFNPQNLDQLLQAVRMQAAAQRTHVVLRLTRPAAGVALDGKSLPDLPPSMVHILSSARRTGVQTISDALTARQPSEWVIAGNESIRFRVSKERRE